MWELYLSEVLCSSLLMKQMGGHIIIIAHPQCVLCLYFNLVASVMTCTMKTSHLISGGKQLPIMSVCFISAKGGFHTEFRENGSA